MLATTFVWRKKIAAEVVVTRKGSPLMTPTVGKKTVPMFGYFEKTDLA
jgi:hypothetical protein